MCHKLERLVIFLWLFIPGSVKGRIDLFVSLESVVLLRLLWDNPQLGSKFKRNKGDLPHLH